MKKKRTKKKEKAQKNKEPKGDETQDRDDFGGFPDRDLKKNLGCG